MFRFLFLFLFLFVTLSFLPLITCSDLLYSHRSRIKTQYTPKHSLRHAQHVMQVNDPGVTSTQYNPFTGASLYYPSDVSLVYDIRDPYISAFYDMVETAWNNGTLLFLQHTTTATRPDEGAIRLFLGYPNQTRQEILNDYWTLNHPWYLGQDLAYDAQADPNSVVVTFEGIASPFNYRFMMLGFSLISLNETDGVHVRPHYMNESLANWVTRFRLPAGRTEPLYRTDGVITNPNWIMPASQQLILSQFTGVTSYVVKRITGTPTNPESGFLLLIRTMNFNAIRLIKYNNNMEIKFDTILVPTIQGTHSQADVPRPGSVVGHIDVDPDGHVYVLTDIMPYQRSIVTSYHNKFLAPEDGNTKPSILFLIDHDTGNIIRADWVPLHLAIPFDRAITTGLSVEAGEGQVALLFNGVKYPSEYGTLINFIDYDVENNYTSPPLAHSATINTYPQAIADACHQESRQTQAYAVTFLKDGRYAVGGSHGFGLTEDGQFFTPSMGFLAIFDLEELHVRGLTSKQVWNIGVVGRDNIVTHLASSPDGGLTFGMTLDGNAEDETNTTLQYYHSGVFKTVQNWGAKERCDAVTRMSIENATWTLTCGAESCISWCTSFVPNLSERPLPPYNLVASPLCATTVAPPTRPPTTQPPWIIPTDQPTASPTTIAPVPTDPPSSSASPATNAPVSSTGAGNGGGTAVTGSTKSSTGSSSSSFRPSSGSTAVDAAQGGTDQTSNTSPSSSSSRATALGVGLGIGLVGGLCLIIALVVLCMRRHKRAINTDMTTEGVPMHMGAGVRHQQLTNEI